MGSAVSTTSVPEKLNETDVKAICGEFFDKNKFDEIKDDDGSLSKENFLSAVHASVEREVFNVYMTYCKNGEMDINSFGRLFRDAKLLNKSFTRKDVGIVFIQLKHRELSAHTKTIHFTSFRRTGIPNIAAKKGVTVEHILYRIARSEGAVSEKHLNDTEQSLVASQSSPLLYTKPELHTALSNQHQILQFATESHSASARPTSVYGASRPVQQHSSPNSNRSHSNTKTPSLGDKESKSVPHHAFASATISAATANGQHLALHNTALVDGDEDLVTEPSCSRPSTRHQDTRTRKLSVASVGGASSKYSSSNRHHEAAITIQKSVRKKIARNSFKLLLKMQEIKKKKLTDVNFPQYFFEDSNEKLLYTVYNAYSQHSEMTQTQFVKLMKSAHHLNKMFTTHLAYMIFHEAIAKAETCESGPIHDGVVFGKRIRYDVFRRILLIEVASIKRIPIESLVETVAVRVAVAESIFLDT